MPLTSSTPSGGSAAMVFSAGAAPRPFNGKPVAATAATKQPSTRAKNNTRAPAFTTRRRVQRGEADPLLRVPRLVFDSSPPGAARKVASATLGFDGDIDACIGISAKK